MSEEKTFQSNSFKWIVAEVEPATPKDVSEVISKEFKRSNLKPSGGENVEVHTERTDRDSQKRS